MAWQPKAQPPVRPASCVCEAELAASPIDCDVSMATVMFMKFGRVSELFAFPESATWFEPKIWPKTFGEFAV